MHYFGILAFGLFGAIAAPLAAFSSDEGSTESLQELIDRNPGRIVDLPAGSLYKLEQSLELHSDGSGVRGGARIIMTSSTQSFFTAKGRKNLTLSGVTLERSTNSPDNTQAVYFESCDQVNIEGVNVVSNRSLDYTVYLRKCRDCRITNCTILDYKQTGLNVRPTYSFNCIDGHGIVVRECENSYISGNSILERGLIADEATRDRLKLGTITKGESPNAETPGYFLAWHQGAGIGSFRGRNSIITNNYIENACQGCDFQTDDSVLTGNIIRYVQTGIKCMHGTRHVVISNNNVSFTDLWGLIMAPGPNAHPAWDKQKFEQLEPQRRESWRGHGGMHEDQAELNNGSVISGNVFSNFGFGHEYYNWRGFEKVDDGFMSVINLQGQYPHLLKIDKGLSYDPASGMRDLLFQGNVIYDDGGDGRVENGKAVFPSPRFRYAMRLDLGQYRPDRVLLTGNIFHRGSEGILNREPTAVESQQNLFVKREQHSN